MHNNCHVAQNHSIELPFSPCPHESSCKSNRNEFDLHENESVCGIHFHMNVSAFRFVMTWKTRGTVVIGNCLFYWTAIIYILFLASLLSIQVLKLTQADSQAPNTLR